MQRFLDDVPMKRFGEPEEIGELVLFMCSDACPFMTADTVYMNGGLGDERLAPRRADLCGRDDLSANSLGSLSPRGEGAHRNRSAVGVLVGKPQHRMQQHRGAGVEVLGLRIFVHIVA
jgi:Enoyl-(Acyl carrier protein) reductase